MKYILIVFAVLSALLTAIFPSVSSQAASDALVLCANVLIPSLFPFFVCANMLIALGVSTYLSRAASRLMNPLFSVNGAGALPIIMGLISGYPCGAAITCRLYDEKSLTRDEAQRLLGFANNSGPLFIIGAVGAGMLGNVKTGVILYLAHVMGALLTGVFLSFFARKEAHKKVMAGGVKKTVADAIPSAVVSVLTLCGYVVFFSVMLALLRKTGLISILCKALCFVGMGESEALLVSGGFFEITSALFSSGCRSLPCISAVLSLGGVSVLLQTASFARASGLSLKQYIIGKLMCAGFSSACTKLLTAIFPATVTVFSSVAKGKIHIYTSYATAFLLCVILFLFFYLNLNYNEKKRRKTSKSRNFPSNY